MHTRKKLLRDDALKLDEASIGIGAMIVFIAMILVAGIAASVLIQTSNNIETRALTSGQETKDEISSGIGVYQIIGQYGTRNLSGSQVSAFHNMTIIVTSRSGGSTIDLGEVVITISDGTKKCALSWDNTKFSSTSSGSGIFSTSGLYDLGASKFGIIVLEDADGSCTSGSPGMNKGDKIALTLNMSAYFGGISFREDIKGKVIPENGASGIFLFRAPAATSRTVVELL